MQAITKKVFIEDGYPGVTLGAVSMPRGLVQIDAPPAADDARAWRASLMGIGAGTERVLINLDAHPDRTLGVRAMDCTVIAHEKTAHVFRNRPNTFKAQGDETGADWESIPGLGSIRWAPPEISFGQQMTLYWGETPILLEHHPGPAAGAIWVILPAEKVVFVGDLVLKNQPPFLANADLPRWVESIQHLLGGEFKGYTIVCGRGGTVNSTTIKNQLDYVKRLHEKLERLAARRAAPDATEALVQKSLTGFRATAARQRHFAQRLRYGLRHYYVRHYRPSGSNDEE
ncbi:MAG: MBL fold metallo-hydrolase [Chloroflexota bacterium]